MATHTITVDHAADEQRYLLRDGTKIIGSIEYSLPNETQVDLTHTNVDEAYSGQGLASKLAEFAITDVQSAGKRIIPTCPYIAKWLERHPEYADIVDQQGD